MSKPLTATAPLHGHAQFLGSKPARDLASGLDRMAVLFLVAAVAVAVFEVDAEVLDQLEGEVEPLGESDRVRRVRGERGAREGPELLRPLSRKELAPTLRRVMKLAAQLGFTVPAEAAIHAHFDAAPHRSTRALRKLVLADLAALRAQLEPNPRCRKLGPPRPTPRSGGSPQRRRSLPADLTNFRSP